MPRIAIVDQNKCKPEKCSKECIKACPPQRNGSQVIDIEDIGNNNNNNNQYSNLKDKKKIAKIAESLCIGCNQCVIRCPFNAIKIVNLPDENTTQITHRYGLNGFKLFGVPILKQGIISGLVGSNGIGKTTLMDIIGNNIKPNFEEFNKNLTNKEIITKFRGTVMQDYFNNLLNNKLQFSIKNQKIKNRIQSISITDYLISNSINVNDINNNQFIKETYELMEIDKIINLNLNALSGGQLQRLECWITAVKDANVYIFDEPTNFLDIKQRLNMSKLLRKLCEYKPKSYILIVEHDLSILDWISDEIYILFGKPSAYGIISKPLTTLEGINMYLSGYITTQNIRFRDEEFNFRTQTLIENKNVKTNNVSRYNSININYDNFSLYIPDGEIDLNGSINVIVGENGTGKTTFINNISELTELPVSIKSQLCDIKKFMNLDKTWPTVNDLLNSLISINYNDSIFKNIVVNPLEINSIQNRKINELSGGELQRLLITICLGSPSEMYLLDEPSANLDIEKRLNVVKIIKTFVSHYNKTVFVIEHDITMCVALGQEINSYMYLVKRNINNSCEISNKMTFTQGINEFLKLVDITMRISVHSNFRPRINKPESQLDKQQKLLGNFYGNI